jgi:hypothetical protein
MELLVAELFKTKVTKFFKTKVSTPLPQVNTFSPFSFVTHENLQIRKIFFYFFTFVKIYHTKSHRLVTDSEKRVLSPLIMSLEPLTK